MNKQREAFEAWFKQEYPNHSNGYLEWDVGADEYVLGYMEFAFEAWQAAQQAKIDSYWKPSGKDYDKSIHHNPDAKAWADFFVETFPAMSDRHDVMLAWFANAMMAMHDHVHAKQQAKWQPIETAPRDGESVIAYRKGKHGIHIEGMPLPPEPKR